MQPLRRFLRERHWAGGLAALALTLHLLVPALCLAHQLSSVPLGALCTADAGRTAPVPNDGGATSSHLLEHCDHCVPGTPWLVETSSHSAAPLPAATAAPRRPSFSPPPALPPALRPPPRGPPPSA